MLFKKLAATAVLSGFCATATSAAADQVSDINMLKAQINALSKKVEKQQAVFNEELTHYIKNEINNALKDHRGGNLLTLGGSHVEGLKLKGDLRVRYENIEKNNNINKNRFRQRFRLGFTWKTSEGWEIGAGLATGSAGDNTATSTNSTYNDNFGTGSINLDYAYVKYKFDNGVSFIAGQHKNPFLQAAGTLFDSDARFIGATIHAQCEQFFGTAGIYTLSPDTGDDAQDLLIAGQAGYSANGLTIAGAIYHFNGQDNNIDDDYNVDPDPKETDKAKFNDENDITALSGLIQFKGKADAFSYKVFGEYTVNIDADDNASQVTYSAGEDAKDNNVAWALGAEIKIDKLKLGYTYAHIEGDAFYNALDDGDFGAGTSNGTADTKGHRIKAGYSMTSHSSIGVTYIISEDIEAGSDEQNLLQLDFAYKF